MEKTDLLYDLAMTILDARESQVFLGVGIFTVALVIIALCGRHPRR